MTELEESSTRIVACFRWRTTDPLPDGDQYLSAAEAIIARGAQLGVRVVAWHATSFAVDFAPDRIDELVDLVASDDQLAVAFCVGVAEGELGVIAGAADPAAFAWGPALIRAWGLSRVARPGEVLLDPKLDAVRREQLLVRGSRIGKVGNTRVRGLRLDLRHPRRPDRGYPTLSLVRAPYVGRSPVSPPAGTLGLVTGRHGLGGTRWLEELAAREPDRRTLFLRPRLGEPLGALRRALTRAIEAASELDEELASSFESVLAGEGGDLETTTELVSKLLKTDAGTGLVLVDDAENVDADSLDAVARGCGTGAFALVVRTVDAFALPDAFRDLPRAFEVELQPLSAKSATDLAMHLTSRRVSQNVAARWARRGDGVPAAIEGALADALESGDLISSDDSFSGRTPMSGRGDEATPAFFFGRRVRRWDPTVRATLACLAILGGECEEEELIALLALAQEPLVSVVNSSIPVAPSASAERWAVDEEMLQSLEAAGLLRRDGRCLSLSSATLRDALSDEISEGERARLHRAAAAVLAGGDLPVSAVAAAVHSMLGGDVDRALPLVRRGAGVLRASGLEDTADAFDQFSSTGDPAPVRDRGLFAGARAERAGLQRSDVPPPLNLSHPPTRLSRPPSSGQEVAHRFVQALKHRDHAAIEVLAAELRDDGAQQVIADRLEGMASLTRGQVSDALRLLRRAKDGAKLLGPADRSRAALALGVALAAAGRGTEALLEGLEALARAREAHDGRGELACAKFLSRLSSSAGSADAAARWEVVAAQAVAPV
jgi:hypothetical protein